MEFINDIKVSDTITDPNLVISILDSGVSVRDIYCICINKKSNNLLEIIHSPQLTNEKYYSLNDYVFIGLCKGKFASKSFAGEILIDYFHKYKNFYNFRTYYLHMVRRI